VVFVQPSSNLLGSGLELLLDLAGSDGRPRPTNALPYGLQLVIVRPRHFVLDSNLFRGTHNPTYRVPVQTG
jgi:hypothetical protein